MPLVFLVFSVIVTIVSPNFASTVEPPCATTSHKRPPIQNTKLFPVKALQLEPLVNDHPPVSDRDHFLSLTVNDFPLLTCCKRLHSHSLISIFAVCTMLLKI